MEFRERRLLSELPELRSDSARDQTTSGVILRLYHDPHRQSENKNELQILTVYNKGDAARSRPGKYGEHDRGKASGWGIPTGGNESREPIKGVMEREIFDETGFPVRKLLFYFGYLPKIDRRKIEIEEFMELDSERIHPHHLFVAEVDDYEVEIREKAEIKKAKWQTLEEILLRGDVNHRNPRGNPEGFYESHLMNFIYPVLEETYGMTEAEMRNPPKGKEYLAEPGYQHFVRTYQPYIRREIFNCSMSGILPLEDETEYEEIITAPQ